MKRAHFFQHVPFEGLGCIKPWLKEAGFEISQTDFFNDEKELCLPNIEDIDLLIIMGGPMSVNDEQTYPWLKLEKHFLNEAIQQDKRILGVCLGAQLIAAAMGAKVLPNPETEIGWFDIKAVPIKSQEVFQLPDIIKVFHWHGETFNLPKNAIHLAKSEACEHQAFQLGTGVIGLQFHLETTPALAEALVQRAGGELVLGRFIQTETQILGQSPAQYSVMHDLMGQLLLYLTRDLKYESSCD